MTLTMCVLTVLTVNWKAAKFVSRPNIVPCAGYDHVTRLEVITAEDKAELQALQYVLDSQVTASVEAEDGASLYDLPDFIGPRPFGRHYQSMFREQQQRLSHDRMTRLISITERVGYTEYGNVEHLFNRLSVSAYDPAKERFQHHLNITTRDNQTTSLVVDMPLLHEQSDLVEPPVQNVTTPSRSKRGVTDINTHLDTEVHVENNRDSQQHDSSHTESESSVTGGGYGSNTCLNTEVSSWNNSTFTNGACECGGTSCPPCETGRLMQMITDAGEERKEIQQQLNQCMERQTMSTNPSTRRRSSSAKCVNSETRRLKEETRNLRARLKRMVSANTSTATIVASPTSSTAVSSFESIGDTLVQSVVDHTVEKVSQYVTRKRPANERTATLRRNSNQRRVVATSRSEPTKASSTVVSKTTAKAPTKSKTRKVIHSQTKNRRTMGKGRNPSKSRSRRSIEYDDSGANIQNVNIDLTQISNTSFNQHHFGGPDYRSSLHIGNGADFIIPRTRILENSRQIDCRCPRSRGRRSVRRARDLNQAHFTGANNNAHAFNRSTFYGSTENRTDNSVNVRNFRPEITPVVSPRINVTSRGANETIIHKSNNGNDINIVTANPCSCDGENNFNFRTLLWSIWLQICISLSLALGVTVHYHMRSRTNRLKRKDQVHVEQLQRSYQFSSRDHSNEISGFSSTLLRKEPPKTTTTESETACAIVV